MTLTQEQLEAWWQEELKKIKPLPAYYFAHIDKPKSDKVKKLIRR